MGRLEEHCVSLGRRGRGGVKGITLTELWRFGEGRRGTEGGKGRPLGWIRLRQQARSAWDNYLRVCLTYNKILVYKEEGG